MKEFLNVFLIMLACALSSRGETGVVKVGECWSYQTRPAEEGSFVIIRKIETLPKIGEVVHVSVCDLKLKTRKFGYADHIDDLPILAASLRKSLSKKNARCPCEADWMAGYSTWRKAYDAGRIQRYPAYPFPVSQCVSFIERTMNE